VRIAPSGTGSPLSTSKLLIGPPLSLLETDRRYVRPLAANLRVMADGFRLLTPHSQTVAKSI
jgi:hypothetical protein